MAKYKAFNVHDLYPADYVFPWDKFESDPEGYQFTSEDIAYTNAMELEEYELKTPMTPYEKRALRRWVAAGHSVRETPPSRYPCAYPSHPAPDFLDVYRTDRELDAATKGMSKAQKLAYLQEYTGLQAETQEERHFTNRRRKLPGKRSGCFKDNFATPGCTWLRKGSMRMRMLL